MKEQVLVVIKPDGITKALVGYVLTRLQEANLELVASRMVKVSRGLAKEHYKHLKGKSFFEEAIQYSLGAFHARKYVLALVYWGEGAIKKCRRLAGKTNPEEADPGTIRGSCGRITTKGVFENVLHVSSNVKEAKREIKLWFEPGDIVVDFFPTKKKTIKSFIKRVWA